MGYLSASLPNGQQVIQSTHTATLNLPSLPLAARSTHIFPTLTGSLLSISMLTDAGLTAIYTADAVTIQDAAGITVLSGSRSPSKRLWMIDLPAPPSPPSTYGVSAGSTAVSRFSSLHYGISAGKTTVSSLSSNSQWKWSFLSCKSPQYLPSSKPRWGDI